MGCAVAYSLAEAGRKDILLLEKEDSLATQTTSQAAGLVGQVRSTVAVSFTHLTLPTKA